MILKCLCHGGHLPAVCIFSRVGDFVGTAKKSQLAVPNHSPSSASCRRNDWKDVRLKPICCLAVRTRDQMSVQIDSNLNRMMPHLFLDVSNTLTLLKHQTRISVAKVVNSNPAKFGLLK